MTTFLSPWDAPLPVTLRCRNSGSERRGNTFPSRLLLKDKRQTLKQVQHDFLTSVTLRCFNSGSERRGKCVPSRLLLKDKRQTLKQVLAFGEEKSAEWPLRDSGSSPEWRRKFKIRDSSVATLHQNGKKKIPEQVRNDKEEMSRIIVLQKHPVWINILYEDNKIRRRKCFPCTAYRNPARANIPVFRLA